jgi:branched-chain amino acid transport system ATP-binding protein
VTASQALLSVKGLRVRYGPALALDDITVEVGAGQAVAVLGPNGAGKSTLARAVSGLVPTEAGAVHFDGTDVTKMSAHQIRRRGLVCLPEGRGIFPALTVTENLRLAAILVPRATRRAAIERGLEIFPSLAARRGTKAGMLSGGEQQMLSLCRAFILRPKLIIADEMSLGLAPKLVDQVFESLAALKQNDVTILVVEQFVHRALEFADHAVLLSRGSVAWQGPSATARHEVLARYLGETAVPVDPAAARPPAESTSPG